jgi:transposase
MDADPSALPDDIEALKAALLAAVARADAAQTEAAVARAEQSDAHALIVHLKLQIEKLRRELYGQRSERSARLLDQMELQLEELDGGGHRG